MAALGAPCQRSGAGECRVSWSRSISGVPVALAVTSKASDGPPARSTGTESGVSGVVAVEVSDRGFLPSSVTIAPGASVELEFKRTTDETCASSVVFPELGINEELALHQPVRIKVPADQRRTLAFQCGVGDHRSAVIIS